MIQVQHAEVPSVIPLPIFSPLFMVSGDSCQITFLFQFSFLLNLKNIPFGSQSDLRTYIFFLSGRQRCGNKSLPLSSFLFSLQLNAVWYSQSQTIYKKLSLSLPNSDALLWASTRTVRHSRSNSVINANAIPSEVSPFSGECVASRTRAVFSAAVIYLICPAGSNIDLLLELLFCGNTY